jgi:O-antigen ligase
MRKRLLFDILVAIFLSTAGLGVWVAYQQTNALRAFGFLIAAAVLFLVLSRMSGRYLWWVAGLLSGLGLSTVIYFLLSNNWVEQTQKFQLLSQIGELWMQFRPNLALKSMNPNDIAGLTGLTLPFSIALTLKSHSTKFKSGTLLFGLISLLTLSAILFTQSRGSFTAIAVTIGLWALWIMIRSVAPKRAVFQRIILGAILAIMATSVFVILWMNIQGRMTNLSIGSESASISDQRFHVFLSDIELIKDVPFSGAGLASFPGLYSSYILINPNYILGYGHNIFLDAALQQGILGGLVLLMIYLGSILWLALHPVNPAQSLLRIAVLSSLLIILIHSLTDNIVYRSYYTPLLFVVPGMAVGLMGSRKRKTSGINPKDKPVRRLIIPGAVILGLLVVSLLAFRRPILSAWYTNLGAVEMAKVELADFPTNIWDEGQHTTQLATAESLFYQALDYEPENPRAHYRLGLIALSKRDFPEAVEHLEMAHQGDPYHRGMLKALGLAYVWNGQVADAVPLLSLIPEARQELSIYPWWWQEHDRPDLAAYAQQYLAMVGTGQ